MIEPFCGSVSFSVNWGKLILNSWGRCLQCLWRSLALVKYSINGNCYHNYSHPCHHDHHALQTRDGGYATFFPCSLWYEFIDMLPFSILLWSQKSSCLPAGGDSEPPNVGEKPHTPFLLLPLVFLQPTNYLVLCLCQLSSGDSQRIWRGFWWLSGAASLACGAQKASTPSYLAPAVTRELCNFSTCPNASGRRAHSVPAGRWRHPGR